jgi:hypothetical protein
MFMQQNYNQYEQQLELFQTLLRHSSSDNITLVPELKKNAKQLYSIALKVYSKMDTVKVSKSEISIIYFFVIVFLMIDR